MNIEKAMFEDHMDDIIRGERELSLQNLKSINSNLQEYAPEEISVIMDFLCKDKEFAKITQGSAENLQSYISGVTESSEREDAESIITLFLLGFTAWKIWHWVDNKTVLGLNDWMSRHNPNSVDSEMFNNRARVPDVKQFMMMQKGITKCLPTLAKMVEGKSVSDSEINSCMKLLGFQCDVSRFDDYTGHLWAFLVASVKGVGIQVIGWAAFVIVGVLSLGILYVPAAIVASIWIGVKTGVAYKRAYEEFQTSTPIINKGWNKSTFVEAMNEFKRHYAAISAFASKLDRLKGDEIYTRSEAAHAHLFTDALYMEIKLEARVLGTIVAILDKILDTNVTPW